MHATVLDPQSLLLAYSQGAFPMTDRDGVTRWYTADPRGVIPLDRFHIPKSLRPVLNRPTDKGGFEIRINHDFHAVMRACMKTRPDGSWISEQLIGAYVLLHDLGFAHSVEAWKNGQLAGGLYGVSLGGAFFGESMFHYERDASKVALVHLVRRLNERGFELLDTQSCTPHLARFGCIQIPARRYLALLEKALEKTCQFD